MPRNDELEIALRGPLSVKRVTQEGQTRVEHSPLTLRYASRYTAAPVVFRIPSLPFFSPFSPFSLASRPRPLASVFLSDENEGTAERISETRTGSLLELGDLPPLADRGDRGIIGESSSRHLHFKGASQVLYIDA